MANEYQPGDSDNVILRKLLRVFGGQADGLDGSNRLLAKILTQAQGVAFGANVNLVNAQDFGVVGDGMTDDTAKLQTIIDTVSDAGGGIVYLPAGTYSVTESAQVNRGSGPIFKGCIVMRSGVHLLGEGRNTILKVSSATATDNPVIYCPKQHPLEGSGAIADFSIRNLAIDGTKSRVTGTTSGVNNYVLGENEGIDIKPNVARWKLADLFIIECGQDAIDVDGGISGTIENVTVEDCGGNALHCSTVDGVDSDDLKIVNFRAVRCAMDRGAAVAAALLTEAGGIEIAARNSHAVNLTAIDCYRGVSVFGGVVGLQIENVDVVNPAQEGLYLTNVPAGAGQQVISNVRIRSGAQSVGHMIAIVGTEKVTLNNINVFGGGGAGKAGLYLNSKEVCVNGGYIHVNSAGSVVLITGTGLTGAMDNVIHGLVMKGASQYTCRLEGNATHNAVFGCVMAGAEVNIQIGSDNNRVRFNKLRSTSVTDNGTGNTVDNNE